MLGFYKCHFLVLKSRTIWAKPAPKYINYLNTGIYQDVDRCMGGELVAKYHNCTIFNDGGAAGQVKFL